jgi:hypothetical protein
VDLLERERVFVCDEGATDRLSRLMAGRPWGVGLEGLVCVAVLPGRRWRHTGLREYTFVFWEVRA